jgi:hypothetical protein
MASPPGSVTPPNADEVLEQAIRRHGQADVAGRPISVVLPVPDGEAQQIAVRYGPALAQLPSESELVLVSPGGDASGLPRRVGSTHVRVAAAAGGWGAKVRAGLQATSGDLLSYANPSKTSPEILTLILAYALAYPGTVLRPNRRARESALQKLGSFLYNAECRMLLGVTTWDVNATPKVFPREFDCLLSLDSDDELIDAEFTVVCERQGYPVLEIPVAVPLGDGARSSTGLWTALRLYTRAVSLRSKLRGDEAIPA